MPTGDNERKERIVERGGKRVPQGKTKGTFRIHRRPGPVLGRVQVLSRSKVPEGDKKGGKHGGPEKILSAEEKLWLNLGEPALKKVELGNETKKKGRG